MTDFDSRHRLSDPSSTAGSDRAMPRAVPLQPGSSAQPQPITARPIAVTGQSAMAIHQRDDLEEPEEISSAAVRNAPPWLISAAVHMVILIILGVWLIANLPGDSIELVVEPDIYAEELGDQTEFDSPLGIDDIEEIQEPELAISELPPVEDPFATPPDVEPYPDGTFSTSDLDSRVIGLALKGREEGSKRSLLGKYGGNKTTQAAVIAGLRWLARNQQPDGSWSLAGPFSGGVPQDMDNRQAATAMALLAFQGNGDTHQKGEFRKNVVAGWNWLLKQQDANGNFYHEGRHSHRFYTQGQCTIAICELVGMTGDPKYKEPAQRALDYCLKTQSAEGGWRYDPGIDTDVSVTGWLVMALQSARMAGFDVPQDHFDRVTRYLDSVQRDGGSRYPYQRGEQIKLSMTAEALLMRQYLGWDRDNPALVTGMKWITSQPNLISYNQGRDVYYWYYATQAAHHMEGETWKRWNAVMRQIVPENQVKTGRESGSWDYERPTLDTWGPQGGRLFVTCLSIYMLEVYYRHLPIYSNIYSDLRKSGRNPL